MGQLATKLLPYIDAGYPILTVEPSCHTALTDDLADLLDDKVLALRIKSSIQPIEQFLVAAWKSGQLKGKFKASAEDILLHGHCHQKASYGTSSALELLTLAGAKVKKLLPGAVGWRELLVMRRIILTFPKNIRPKAGSGTQGSRPINGSSQWF